MDAIFERWICLDLVNFFLKSCHCWFWAPLTKASLFSWQFNDIINVPFSSEAFVAGILAYFLDNTLHRKDSSVRKDRGRHWWDKYRTFKGDSRSEEFYALPFNLNKYFPSVWYYKVLYQILLCWRFKSSLRDHVINHCYFYYIVYISISLSLPL